MTTNQRETLPRFIIGDYSKESHQKVIVECDYNAVPKCKKEFVLEYRTALKNTQRNDNTSICLYCSRFLKFSGRRNPNCKYNFDDNYMSSIDTERKAYFLGWIASDGSISPKGTISFNIHKKDRYILDELRDLICTEIPLKLNDENKITLSINSKQMTQDVCRYLSIEPGKKDSIVQFPKLDDTQLSWDFLRGYFDGDGSVNCSSSGYPRCSITSNSQMMLESIKKFSGYPCYISKNNIEWGGINVLDFLGRLYKDSSIYLKRKYDKFVSISSWEKTEPWFRWNPITKCNPKFKWARTCSESIKPTKSRSLASGSTRTRATIMDPE